MMLLENNPVPDVVLPLAQLKEHLRLATGFADDADQDAILLRHLRAAMAVVEAYTGKILIARDFTWTLFALRDDTRLALPVAPMIEVLHLTQIDPDGTGTVTDPARWHLVPDPQTPFLRARHASLPAVPRDGALRIGLRAGLAADWAGLPADIALAALMLAAHHYDTRHDLNAGQPGIPVAVRALIDRFRNLRLSAGARP